LQNPFAGVLRELEAGGKKYKYYSLPALEDERLVELPYSIRVLLEAAIRNCDEFEVKKSDVEKILNWKVTSKESVEIPHKPARVLLQDFTYANSFIFMLLCAEADNFFML
jgi:aconitate hydratase